MNIYTPEKKAKMKKQAQVSKPTRTEKPYTPVAHPMQHRLDIYRAVPSLVTAPKHLPSGK